MCQTRPSNAVSTTDNSAFDPYITTENVADPSGTTTNLYDYWVFGENVIDSYELAFPFSKAGAASTTACARVARTMCSLEEKYQGSYEHAGINDGHQLRFAKHQLDSETLANRNSGIVPRSGLVAKTLNNGYPYLNVSGVTGITSADDLSLAYLYDTNDGDGKRAYPNVSGLLQLDDQGYYYYDSTKNFASYNAESNRFDLYRSWGVNTGWNTGNGQFFPFNKANQVFAVGNDGKPVEERDTKTGATYLKPYDNPTEPTQDPNFSQLVADGRIDSRARSLNHYFGMSMHSQFVQKNGGHTLADTNTPVTYTFTGDDDVWVYIDGVLVGDLGGIHDALKLNIDFSTGDVTISDAKGGNVSTRTTLKALFEAAGKADDTEWNGNTFADDTYHSLSFFYMERGNWDSNMSLRFNLVYIPPSNVVKVNQDGQPLEGVDFALYGTDEQYDENNATLIIAQGTTASDGTLTLRDVNDADKILSFDGLAKQGYTHFLLKETKVPAGYSKMIAPMRLEYKQYTIIGPNRHSGFIASVPENIWQTGSYASPVEQIVAPSMLTLDDGTELSAADAYQNGQLFAVILRYTGPTLTDSNAAAELSKGANWHSVYAAQAGTSTGTLALADWRYTSTTGMQGIVDAYRDGSGKNRYQFTQSSLNQLDVVLEHMPGDLTDYHQYLKASGQSLTGTKFAVGVYYSTADSPEAVTAANTTPVKLVKTDGDDETEVFTRTFATQLNVTNIKNEINVQKLDSSGVPLEGAEFGLYRADDAVCTATEAGDDCQISDTATAYDTVTTTKDGGASGYVGGAQFPSAGHVLAGRCEDAGECAAVSSGVYYIKETKAPSGYEPNDRLIKVYIDDTGVYADAGTAHDGVKVMRTVGNLVAVMAPFGAHHLDAQTRTGLSLDNTLAYIKTAAAHLKTTDDDLLPDTSLAGEAQYNGTLYRAIYDGTTGVTTVPADSDAAVTGANDNAIQLEYGTGDKHVSQYGPSDLVATDQPNYTGFVNDTGWFTLRSTQDPSLPKTSRQPDYQMIPQTQSLGALVTGEVTVQVTDYLTAKASFKVKKIVAGASWTDDKTFRFVVTPSEGAPLPDAVTTTGGGAGGGTGDGDDSSGSAGSTDSAGTAGTLTTKVCVPASDGKSCTVTIAKTTSSTGNDTPADHTVTIGALVFSERTLLNTDGTWDTSKQYTYVVQEIGVAKKDDGSFADAPAGSGGVDADGLTYSKAKYTTTITLTRTPGEVNGTTVTHTALDAAVALTRNLNDDGTTSGDGSGNGGSQNGTDSAGQAVNGDTATFTNGMVISALPLTGGYDDTAASRLLRGAALAGMALAVLAFARAYRRNRADWLDY